MRVLRSVFLIAVLLLAVAGCDSAAPMEEAPPEIDEQALRAGGATTVFEFNSNAFSTPAPNLSGAQLEKHLAGDRAFEQIFVSAPSEVAGGLGPAFNRNACLSCHVRDGRDREALALHLSAAGQTGAQGGPASVEGFGLQLQDRALFGVVPEGRLAVEYEDVRVQLADGTPFTLRQPVYRIEDPYAPLPTRVNISPRTPRPVFGLGLLEAVPEETLRGLVRQQAEGGAVSGEMNRVWDVDAQQIRAGRFGWKADRPSLLQQTADAYHRDMGLTSPLLPDESTRGQAGYDDGEADDPELTRETLEATTFYVQTLGVPARRRLDDPSVQRGQALFDEIGCQSCHVRRLETGTLDGVPEVSGQTIYPYTDLLLHDMGEGLADGRPVFEASGREWRTPPLWGLGLSDVVNGETHFLHDGRARSLTEAILWHGGEADAANAQFRRLSEAERSDLLAFLRSL